MKIIYFLPLLLIFLVPQAFAINSLQDISMTAQNSSLSIELEFGPDKINIMRDRIVSEPTLENVTVTMHGDEINLDNARLKVYANGNAFSIADIPQGIIMYGHHNKDQDFYKINILFATDNGMIKQTVRTSSTQQEIIRPTNNVITSKTDIDLHILTDQYERVYNKSDYKFFVKTFDDSVYSGSDFDKFQGKVSGAKVSAIIIDPNGEVKTDVSGFVENGVYEGAVFVPENVWQRGWYTVDIVIEFEGKFYQEQLSFYVFGEVATSDGTNIIP